MKILVVDDHALVREGLCQVLKGLDSNVEILQADSCQQAFYRARRHVDIDLVLLDYHLPDMTGLAALETFGKRHPELPVVMLSASNDTHVMRKSLQAGASGFITKTSPSDELLRAIHLVLQGDIYWPPLLGSELMDATEEPAADFPPLTQRQEKVLERMIDGQSNREIGDALSLSEETIKSHVSAILRHFNVQNRTQAVVAAARRRENKP